jgi:hypothetical protein
MTNPAPTTTDQPSSPPTGWFLYYVSPMDTEPKAAARQYWPAESTVEVWNPSTPTWTRAPILEALSDDSSWVEVTQKEVEAFTGQPGPAPTPDSSTQ